jgi:hypothetical protein
VGRTAGLGEEGRELRANNAAAAAEQAEGKKGKGRPRKSGIGERKKFQGRSIDNCR